MPAWLRAQGSWGGEGAPAPRKRFVVQPKNDAPPRADAKLPHVIINEKRQKGAGIFHVASVPFPYQTREQYERSLQQPLGREWNAQTTFQQVTKPRVITKKGMVIDPIEYKPAAAMAAAAGGGKPQNRRKPLA